MPRPLLVCLFTTQTCLSAQTPSTPSPREPIQLTHMYGSPCPPSPPSFLHPLLVPSGCTYLAGRRAVVLKGGAVEVVWSPAAAGTKHSKHKGSPRRAVGLSGSRESGSCLAHALCVMDLVV